SNLGTVVADEDALMHDGEVAECKALLQLITPVFAGENMPHTPSVRVLIWSGFVALAIAMGIGRFAFTPVLPMMREDLGLGLAQGGWLASANYLGYLAGALTAGFLPWTASMLLRTGLVLVAATTALMGCTSTWSAWIAWRSIAGIASAW